MAAVSTLILAGLAAGSTAYSIYSDRKAAKGARKAGEFEGGMFDQAAEDALERGTLDSYRVGAAARGLKGAQIASQAASGVDVGSGSAADVIANDARLAEMDIATIRENARKEALGLEASGDLARMGGANTAASYNNRAWGTLLGGAASLYDIYSRNGINRTPRRAPARAADNSGGYGTR